VPLQGILPAVVDPADLKLWYQKWRWYQDAALPWNRARLHLELARRRAFAKWPVHGNVLEMLLDGRLEIGEHVLLEPGVWLTAQAPARIRIGGGTFLNLGVQVAAADLVEIGEHCMFANGCFVTDANHRFDDPDKPVPWQGFTTKGPTRVGDNVWCGANVVITSGVTVGERCVIGAVEDRGIRAAAIVRPRRRNAVERRLVIRPVGGRLHDHATLQAERAMHVQRSRDRGGRHLVGGARPHRIFFQRAQHVKLAVDALRRRQL